MSASRRYLKNIGVMRYFTYIIRAAIQVKFDIAQRTNFANQNETRYMNHSGILAKFIFTLGNGNNNDSCCLFQIKVRDRREHSNFR